MDETKTQFFNKCFLCIDCGHDNFLFVGKSTNFIKCNRCNFYYQSKTFKKDVDPQEPKIDTIFKEWVPLYNKLKV